MRYSWITRNISKIDIINGYLQITDTNIFYTRRMLTTPVQIL